MRYHDPGPDKHAAYRDRIRMKRKYGMVVVGSSVRLLDRIIREGSKKKQKRKERGKWSK